MLQIIFATILNIYSYNAFDCELSQHISIHEKPILCIQKQVETKNFWSRLYNRCDRYFSLYVQKDDGSLFELNTQPMLYEDSVELARKLTRNCTCARVDLDLSSLNNNCN